MATSGFIAGKPLKTGSTPKIVERPLIRRRMIDFLMKILGTIPWKCPLPVLSSENRSDRKSPKIRKRLKICLLALFGGNQTWWVWCQYQISYPPTHFRFNRKLSVFRHFYVIGRKSRVETGVIRDAELNDVISFEIRPLISGLNRKLSVFRDFWEISSNLKAKTGVIRGAQSDEVISFEIHQRISG